MEDYVVGNIADIISSSNGSKVIDNYKKHKSNKNDKTLNTIKKFGNNKPANSILKVDNKINKPDLQEFPVQNFSTEVELTKRSSPKNNIKSENPKIKNKSFPKKRKKLCKTDQEVPNQKKIKLNFIDKKTLPSCSKTDENVSAWGNPLGDEKCAKINKENKDVIEKTVFVGNLPVTYDKQKICKEFSKFGEIQNARIRCVPIADINMSKKVAAIKKKFNPKRNSLVAYVNFKAVDSAKAAVKANGMVIDGHHLRIDFAEKCKEPDNNKAVFVGGLPFDIEDDELWEFFEKCGQIKSVRIIRDSHTSMGKGFGYVNFDSTSSVELALQLDGQELKKRTINVKRCTNSRKKNTLNSFGKKKSKEIVNELLSKRKKKLKERKQELEKGKKISVNFQGRTANMKQKKKKKLSKAALRQRKLVKILGAS